MKKIYMNILHPLLLKKWNNSKTWCWVTNKL